MSSNAAADRYDALRQLFALPVRTRELIDSVKTTIRPEAPVFQKRPALPSSLQHNANFHSAHAHALDLQRIHEFCKLCGFIGFSEL